MTTSVYTLQACTDHGDALYEAGESMTFSPLLMAEGRPVGEGVISYKILRDNLDIIDEGSLDLSLDQKSVAASLGMPGFLECRFTFTPSEGDELNASIGAGFSPLKIQPSLPVPDDFDIFWDAQKERLAIIPLTVERTPLPCESCEVSDIQLSCVDETPVSGYLAYRKGAGNKSLPAIISLHGAGVRSANVPLELAEEGFISLDINAHGVPNGRSDDYYQGLAEGRLVDHRSQGFNSSRKEVYFLGMFLRVKRAIEFMTILPQWDGRNLFLLGGSQGAFQAFAGACLDSRVTAIAVSVPAGSDLTGSAARRVTGWPGPHTIFEEEGGDREAVINNARYFDNMNFATRIKVPAIFSVGYVDGCCKPTTVYAVYNNYAGPKEIVGLPRTGHESSPAVHDRFIRFLQEQIRRDP